MAKLRHNEHKLRTELHYITLSWLFIPHKDLTQNKNSMNNAACTASLIDAKKAIAKTPPTSVY